MQLNINGYLILKTKYTSTKPKPTIIYIYLRLLTKFNKGAFILGIKVFNHLPQTIKMMATVESRFKSAL
jgi:hypothetical protein